MGTHATALGITALAYWYARRHRNDPRYSFGTGKVGVLGGFSSAVVLAVVALLMAAESVQRLLAPNPIRFTEAAAVAALGLAVNLVSARILQGRHHHGRDHGSSAPQQHDHNLRAAYLHVLADAMTSLLAIVALLAGRTLGWIWMDAATGIVGAIVILRWAYGLLRDTGRILLDSGADEETVAAIRSAIEADSDNRVSDIHVWRVGSNHLAAIVSVVTHYPKPPEHYKALLADLQVEHVTVEVNRCSSEPCLILGEAAVWPQGRESYREMGNLGIPPVLAFGAGPLPFISPRAAARAGLPGPDNPVDPRVPHGSLAIATDSNRQPVPSCHAPHTRRTAGMETSRMPLVAARLL